MSQAQTNSDDVSERGEQLYQQRIRAEVEGPNNLGKMVIIDVETGEYAVDDTGLLSARYLHTKRPNALLYGVRIGYKAAEALGGVLERAT